MRKSASKKNEKKGQNNSESSNNQRVEKVLIENFIALQKVMTNLATRFDNLSDQISKLLEVFEISAKAIAEKDFEQLKTSDNKDLLEKLDKLLEQNKIIARGLTLMGEKNLPHPAEKEIPIPEEIRPMPSSIPQQERRFPIPVQQRKNVPERLKGYQPSRRF